MSADPGQLIANEEIAYSTHKHWAAVLLDSLWAILLFIGALVFTWIQPDASTGLLGFVARILGLLSIGLFLVSLGWIIYNVVAWRTAEYVVTNLRVFGHEGLLRRRESETLLSSISDIETKQGVLGRALGYGNIRIISAAGRPGTDTFTAVLRPDGFKRNILEQKAARTLGNGSGSGSVSTAADRAEAVQVLTQLANLRDAGAITQAEYEAKRADWVARI